MVAYPLHEIRDIYMKWLEHGCIYILQTVPPVTINHIFREHNMLADGLSKRALKLEVGTGLFSEILDGQVIEDGHFLFF